MSWSTMRVKNGDGSSTVYKVHESLGGGAAEQFVLGGCDGVYGPPPGHYGNPISPTSVMVPQEVFGSPCGHHHHHQPASPHSFGGPFGPHHQLGAASPNVIVVESGTGGDGGGYDEAAEHCAAAPVATTPSKSKSRRRPKRPEWCALTTNVCIIGGVFAGLAFVIGYSECPRLCVSSLLHTAALTPLVH